RRATRWAARPRYRCARRSHATAPAWAEQHPSAAGFGLGQFLAALEGLGLEAAAHHTVGVEARLAGGVAVPGRLAGGGAGWQRRVGRHGAGAVALGDVDRLGVVRVAEAVRPAPDVGGVRLYGH